METAAVCQNSEDKKTVSIRAVPLENRCLDHFTVFFSDEDWHVRAEAKAGNSTRDRFQQTTGGLETSKHRRNQQHNWTLRISFPYPGDKRFLLGPEKLRVRALTGT